MIIYTHTIGIYLDQLLQEDLREFADFGRIKFRRKAQLVPQSLYPAHWYRGGVLNRSKLVPHARFKARELLYLWCCLCVLVSHLAGSYFRQGLAEVHEGECRWVSLERRDLRVARTPKP